MGFDSVDLAKAICYRSKINGHILYRNQIRAMMYIVYGKALARKGARITKEHPQAWELGPVFPKHIRRSGRLPTMHIGNNPHC